MGKGAARKALSEALDSHVAEMSEKPGGKNVPKGKAQAKAKLTAKAKAKQADESKNLQKDIKACLVFHFPLEVI